jgi:ATP-dependent DNA helicase DinG
MLDLINRAVEEVFGTEGCLARAIGPSYQVRQGQKDLTREIMGCLEAGDPEDEVSALLAEAPTGVGKSYAAVAALAWWTAVKKANPIIRGPQHKPSVIATATIALQEQLISAVLPDLQQALPWKFTFGLLKGQSHYVCKQKRGGPETDDLPKEIKTWAMQTETGDRADLPAAVPDSKWALLSTTSSECLGARCPYNERGAETPSCYYRRAVKRALDSDIVVANYHAMLAKRGQRLAAFRDIICDEAHELPRLARNILGWSVTEGMLLRLARKIKDMEKKYGNLDLVAYTPEEIEEHTTAFFRQLLGLLEASGTTMLRVEQADLLRVHTMVEVLEGVVDSADASAEGRSGELSARLLQISGYAQEIADHLTDANHLAEPNEWVYWVEQVSRRRAPSASLEGRPYDVSRQLDQTLFDAERHPSIILMSATLRSVNGFDHIRREVGAPSGADEVVVRTPFDFTRNAALICPNYLGPPPKYGSDSETMREYYEYSAAALAQLVLALGGRTMALFTSWAALREVYAILEKAPGMKGFQLLRQGAAPNQELLDSFRAEPASVLFGVATFWQGVDLPGDVLKGLYVHKIPFPSPQDPVTAAMSERIEKRHGSKASFPLWSLPQATVRMQQGVGRLIRTVTDTGIVLCADPRLFRYKYGKKIVQSLPPMSRFDDVRMAGKMLPHLFEVR